MAEILLTNDDGVHSPGIQALAKAVSRLGRVTVVAPDREKSATSQSLTLHHPIRYEAVASGQYAVDGTPTDCVILAIHHILPVKPDLVISGINRGPNLGRDIGYSGTVAGAIEAANQEIPAFAVSLVAWQECEFETAARFAALLAERILDEPLPVGSILNVNIPQGIAKGVSITRQGKRNIRNLVVENQDPRGRKYFWLDQDLSMTDGADHPESDHVAVAAGFVSITPLKTDRTNYDLAQTLSHWPDTLLKAVPVSQ